MEEVLINMGIVAGLTEAVKRCFGTAFSSERFGPLLALTIGVGTAVGGAQLGWYEPDPGRAVLQGIIAGLSASGLYRTVTRQA